MEKNMQILFKEYDTLRTELIARGTQVFQWFALVAVLAVALVTWVGSHGWNNPRFWLILVPFSASLIYIRIRIHWDVWQAAARVRELEKQINDLAGSQLLTYETSRGRAKDFQLFIFFNRFFKKR